MTESQIIEITRMTDEIATRYRGTLLELERVTQCNDIVYLIMEYNNCIIPDLYWLEHRHETPARQLVPSVIFSGKFIHVRLGGDKYNTRQGEVGLQISFESNYMCFGWFSLVLDTKKQTLDEFKFPLDCDDLTEFDGAKFSNMPHWAGCRVITRHKRLENRAFVSQAYFEEAVKELEVIKKLAHCPDLHPVQFADGPMQLR